MAFCILYTKLMFQLFSFAWLLNIKFVSFPYFPMSTCYLSSKILKVKNLKEQNFEFIAFIEFISYQEVTHEYTCQKVISIPTKI